MKKFVSKISLVFFIALVMLLVTTFILPCTPTQADETDPECWGVFVGVSDYEVINDLDFCDDDARDFYEVFSPIWGMSNTKLLVDSQATKSNIMDAISWMIANADADDTVTLTFSGHGADTGALCPYDIGVTNLGISKVELSSALNAIQAEKIVVILDICYSGKFEVTLSKSGRVLMLACRSDELSYEDDELHNGIFSYYLIEALNSFDIVDMNHDFELSAEEIALYANPLTTSFESSQHPVLNDEFIGELALIAKFVFALNIALPAGTNILTLDGIEYTTPPQTQFWIPDSAHTIRVPETVHVASGTRYTFTGWNDGDTLATRTISKGLYIANYNLEQLLSVISTYGDPTGAGWYLDGSTVTFSVTPFIYLPDTKHIFTGWSGDFTGASPTGSFIMDVPKTVTANWRNEYLLTLNSEYGTLAGAGWYDEGETVNISVTPEQGFLIRQIFDGWTGDLNITASSTSLTLDSPKTITAMWHTDYIQLFILIVVILVVAGIVTTIIIIRRKSANPTLPSA